MAIQSNFPAIKPSLLLDFANTKQLDPRITFTRASTATFYDGVTTAKAEQNFIINSNQPASAGWTFTGTVTNNVAVAPDGTTTAAQLVLGSGNQVYQNIPWVTGTSGTVTMYVKAAPTGSAAYFKFATNNSAAWNTGLQSPKVALTSSWQLVTLSGVLQSGTGSMNLHIDGSTFSTGVVDPDCYGNVLVWGIQVNTYATATAYTATTSQAITNYIPVLQTAASGVARFDNNPTTGESLGLLIEESRTNLLTYSAQFDNAVWDKINVSVTANMIVAPDGTLSGDQITTLSTANYIREVGISTSSSPTLSVYAKAGTEIWLLIDCWSSSGAQAWFNLSTGTLGTTAGSVASSSITSVGNGWYRCSVTRTASGLINTDIRIVQANGSTASTTGSYFYLWGAQLENGSFATSYIPTVASQVTRAADAASMTGTNFSSWYNAGQGTLYSDAKCNGITSAAFIAQLNGSNADYIDFGRYQLNLFSTVQANNTNQATLDSALSNSTSHKFAVGYAVNNFAASADGATVVTDTLGLVPNNLTSLVIGNYASSYFLNGTIKKLAYYPIRVTNTQLQALTS